MSNKCPRRLGRCFGSDMRTKAGRGPLGSVATPVAVPGRSGSSHTDGQRELPRPGIWKR